MLLDRIDIDSHGPLARIGVGPFSQQLNVIHTAAGSGKTALVRFLRDSLTGTTPAYAGMAQSSGRVVWAAADGLYHCRREPDGTDQGRRFVDFESRLGGYNVDRFNRPSVVIDLPAAIVDGIVTDTVMTSVRRVVRSIVRSGLDQNAGQVVGDQMSRHQARAAEIVSLRDEIARLREQLRREGHLDGGSVNESQIRDRLAALSLELSAIDSRRDFARQTDVAMEKRRRDRDAMTRSVADVDRLRRQETDLRTRITNLEKSLARIEKQARREENLAAIAGIARKRVAWIDRQIESLRGMLSDVRGLGDAWFAGRPTAGNHWPNRADSISGDSILSQPFSRDESITPHSALGREELAIENRGWLAGSRIDAAFAAGEALAPADNGYSSTAIAARLENICRCVDRLVGRLESDQQHWLNADQTADDIFGEAMSESEQAIRRARRRGDKHFETAADEYVNDLATSGRNGNHRLATGDAGWVEDSVRRQRIDSLHRAERRRRLDELADGESTDAGTEDALLATMRTIGTALHSISRRLRGLNVAPANHSQPIDGRWADGTWSLAAELSSGASIDGRSALPLVEQADVVRRCERELVATLRRLATHRAAIIRRVNDAAAKDAHHTAAAELSLLADVTTLSQGESWSDLSLGHPQTVAASAIRGTDPVDAIHGLAPMGLFRADLRVDAESTWSLAADPLADHSLVDLASARAGARQLREATRRRLEADRRDLVAELKRTIDQMNHKLSEAETLRLRLRTLPVVQDDQGDEALRGRVEAEIQRLHRLLAGSPARSATLARYRQCVSKLRAVEADHAADSVAQSPLAALASNYLQRLSGGRLRAVVWFESADPQSGRSRITATIDGRDEEHCNDTDRFLAALAVRLAASDELAKRGRPLPLVVETGVYLSDSASAILGSGDVMSEIAAESHRGVVPGRRVVAVLAEAASRGRQVLVLTGDRTLADAIVQFGGRGYGLDGSTYFSAPTSSLASHAPVADLNGHSRSAFFGTDPNREFDIAWQESLDAVAPPSGGHANGRHAETRHVEVRHATPTFAAQPHAASAFDQPANGGSVAKTFAAVSHGTDRNGHNHSPNGVDASNGEAADSARDVVAFPASGVSFTRSGHNGGTDRGGRGGAPSNPFFLTGDSPVEHSPSVDALAAARLRLLGVTTVSQLLAASPKELADRIEMSDINAATIRRWQSECRLVCGVRGLRGFDARVLVGCGIVHPREIAEVQPAELVEKVEAFLATDRGADILRTGTSQEVTRLTQWLAESRKSADSRQVLPVRDGSIERSARRSTSVGKSDGTRGQRLAGPTLGMSQIRERRSERTQEDRNVRSRTTESRKSERTTDPVASANPRRSTPAQPVSKAGKPMRFYLERQSPVVDAPSIGPKMAERLLKLKVVTVDDLLKANAAAIATGLKVRRIDESTVRAWQQQAKLVCRVPMLRGHDAQLLVAAGISEPERLAQCDPAWLLSQIEPIARSGEGQTILRGSANPDLAEISDWIRFAQQNRELKAA